MSRYDSRNDTQRDPEKSWLECCQRQTALRRLFPSLFSDVSDEWHEAATRTDFSRLAEVKALPERLTEHNYTRTMRTLLMMETAHRAIEMRKFDMLGRYLEPERKSDGSGKREKRPHHAVRVAGLSEGQLKLIPNDIVIMRSQSGISKFVPIIEVRDEIELVLLPRGKSGPNEKFLTEKLNIFFVSGNILSKFYHKALEKFDRDGRTRSRIFENVANQPAVSGKLQPPRPGYSASSSARSSSYHGKLNGRFQMIGTDMRSAGRFDHPRTAMRLSDLEGAEQRLRRLDEKQRQAATSILKASCFPKPYILFGPPGTGKTHTLAETIAQIYVRKPRDRILYSVNSNTCADQMVEKLKKINLIDSSDIFRLLAGVRADSIGRSRIIVTTNMKSASLMYYREFDYVFVDEAGHAHEPESLIPICCLKGTGCLVLAGDPKQLGPIVKTEQAESGGLGRSLLERVSLFGSHRRDKVRNDYNSKYITKLLVSYRCDPRVLAISNKLFYDDELECVNETPKSILKMMRIDKPLQLLYVKGREGQPKWSTSRRNFSEAKQCVNLIVRLYKMGITPDQIGVITPYKLQATLIRDELKKVLDIARHFFERRFQEVVTVKREDKVQEETRGNCCAARAIESFLEKLKLGQTEGINSNSDESEEMGYKLIRVAKKREDNWLCKIDSVDAFQGNEREIIIISTVRTPGTGRADFINDSRRFNVAISRAKWLVFVVGHKGVLEEQSNWREFVGCAGDQVKKWPRQSPSDFSHPFKLSGRLFIDDCQHARTR